MTTVHNPHGQPVGAPVAGWSRRPWPAPGELAGREGLLEPLGAAHAPGLYAANSGPGRDPLWTYFSYGPFEDPAAHAAALTTLAEDPELVSLAIVSRSTGRPLGTASYLRIKPDAGSLEVGHVLFGPELARTSAATEAMYLMARYALAELGYRRYEWKCDALNAASRAAALRLGFRYEGTFRQSLVYKGRNRDTAWFGMTDSDWRVLAPVYERWLAEGQELAGPLSALTRRVLTPQARG